MALYISEQNLEKYKELNVKLLKYRNTHISTHKELELTEVGEFIDIYIENTPKIIYTGSNTDKKSATSEFITISESVDKIHTAADTVFDEHLYTLLSYNPITELIDDNKKLIDNVKIDIYNIAKNNKLAESMDLVISDSVEELKEYVKAGQILPESSLDSIRNNFKSYEKIRIKALQTEAKEKEEEEKKQKEADADITSEKIQAEAEAEFNQATARMAVINAAEKKALAQEKREADEKKAAEAAKEKARKDKAKARGIEVEGGGPANYIRNKRRSRKTRESSIGKNISHKIGGIVGLPASVVNTIPHLHGGTRHSIRKSIPKKSHTRPLRRARPPKPPAPAAVRKTRRRGAAGRRKTHRRA